MTTAAVAYRRPPPDPRQLQRCLLLAVLLHIWLVLVFGNATGTAAPGQGVWGSLTVKLTGRSGGDAKAPPAESTSESGGSGAPARSAPAEPSPTAADVADSLPSRADLTLPEGFRPVERQELPPLPQQQQLSSELPAPVNRLEARPEAAVTPLSPTAGLRSPNRPVDLPAPSADVPAPVQRLEASPAVPTALPRPAELRSTPMPTAEAPAPDLPAPVPRLEAAAADVTAPSTLPRAADLRVAPAVTAPTTPSAAVPQAVQRLEARPVDTAVATPLPRAADLRTAPTAAAAATAATALPPTVQRMESATTESASTATPLTRPSDLRTPSATAAAPTALPQDLPAAVRRLEASEGASTAPLQQALPRASVPSAGAASLSEPLSGAVPGPVAAPAGVAQGDPAANPSTAPKGTPGTSDANPGLLANVPSPPTPAASAPPRAPLNLNMPRGDMTAKRSPGLVDLLPPPPERKSKLEQSIEDAANKDCRKAYSNAGILAVVPLAVDTVRGKGCKW